jgi:polyisoprenoid-binding protein YceI
VADRFVVTPEASRLTANARSTLHPVSYRGPLAGRIDAVVTEARFDTTEPITATLEMDLRHLESGDAHLDNELRRRLDVDRHPQVRAVVEHVEPVRGDVYRLLGELTLHGVTQAIEGDATVTLDDGRMKAAGSVTLDLRRFGIKPPSLLLVRLHPEVEILIELAAVLEGS